MDDIRLFETDGDYLVLEAQDGQKYRLLIDESVRSSVKKEPRPLLDSISITPREIQEEIRNGATIQDLIDRSGASFDFIEKFAAPVIAELEHIVSSALSVRLTIAGDRYNDSTQIEFGEIISSRLITSGATAISWVAKKLEPSNWHVTANYRLNGVSGSATWSFDPRRLTLSPESETAVTLSSQETLNDSPIPKLRPVDLAQLQPPQETIVLDEVIALTSLETPIAVEPFEPSTPAAFKKLEQPESKIEEPLSATADLLEALRRKRTEREDTQLQPHPETNNIRVIDFEPSVIAELPRETQEMNSELVSEGQGTQAEPKAPKKGRASMPSWDEIVFGTKADD
ncbi:MAG: hypothetical protein RLY34_210 [Actinomycetota bacterium]|jgi:hypothetical protein